MEFFDMKKELLKGLTPEQIAKVKACDNVEDLLQLAKDEDVKLNDEQLEAINGGACSDSNSNRKNNHKQIDA